MIDLFPRGYSISHYTQWITNSSRLSLLFIPGNIIIGGAITTKLSYLFVSTVGAIYKVISKYNQQGFHLPMVEPAAYSYIIKTTMKRHGPKHGMFPWQWKWKCHWFDSSFVTTIGSKCLLCWKYRLFSFVDGNHIFVIWDYRRESWHYYFLASVTRWTSTHWYANHWREWPNPITIQFLNNNYLQIRWWN
jgi:hypothetical protein